MLQYTPINKQKSTTISNTRLIEIVVLFLLFSVVTSCSQNSQEEIDQLTFDTKILPVSTSENIVLRFSDSSKIKIILSAPILERYIIKGEKPYNILTKGMQVNILDSIGNLEATVTCNHAIHYPKKEILILSNDVIVVNKDGKMLNTEHLTWNARTSKIKSDDFVKITTENEIMYGDGFEANQDLTNYSINHIKGIISIEQDELDK